MRPTKFLLITLFFVLAAAAHAASPSILQANTSLCFNNSTSSLACSLPSTMTAGDALIFEFSQGASFPGTQPISVSGCSATWRQVAASAPYNDIFVYMAQNLTATSCTATAAFSGSTQMTAMLYEVTGVPASYVFGISQVSARPGSITTINFAMQEDDLAMGFVNIGPGGGTCNGAATITGWTVQTNSLCNPGGGASSMDNHTFIKSGSAGAYSFSPNWNNTFGINPSGIVITIRSAVPSVGRLQYANFTTASSSTFPQPNTAGDRLIVECENDAGLPTDTLSQAWVPFPIPITSDSSNFYNYYTVFPAAAYSTGGQGVTVTCAGSPATAGNRLWEYTPTYLGASSVFFTQNTGISTIPAGTVQANSNSVLFSIGAVLENTGITFSPSSGFAPVSTGGNGDSLQMWDEIVTPGSYSNTITPSGTNFFPQGSIAVLESASVSGPVLKQRSRASSGAGGDGPRTATAVGPIKSGDLIVVPMTNQSVDLFGPGSMSDSLGDSWNTYFALGTGNGYGLFWTIANSDVAAGSYTVTNSNAQCIALLDFAAPSAPSQDVYATATNLSGASSLSTGNITTTAPNELLLAFSTVDNASYRLGFTSQSTGWSGLGLTCGGHDAALFGGWQPQVATGTYNDTFTWDTSMPITASIAGFKFAGGRATPVVNVLSMKELPKEWRDSFELVR